MCSIQLYSGKEKILTTSKCNKWCAADTVLSFVSDEIKSDDTKQSSKAVLQYISSNSNTHVVNYNTMIDLENMEKDSKKGKLEDPEEIHQVVHK